MKSKGSHFLQRRKSVKLNSSSETKLTSSSTPAHLFNAASISVAAFVAAVSFSSFAKTSGQAVILTMSSISFIRTEFVQRIKP